MLKLVILGIEVVSASMLVCAEKLCETRLSWMEINSHLERYPLGARLPSDSVQRCYDLREVGVFIDRPAVAGKRPLFRSDKFVYGVQNPSERQSCEREV
jgi:hypothetical protein